MKQTDLPPSETRYDDLRGVVSVNFKKDENFNSFASDLIGFNSLKYEAVALRVYVHDHNPIVTLYAIDKERDPFSMRNGKLPVKKFKKEMSYEEVFKSFKNFNFTLISGEYKLEDMEVVE